MFKKQNQQKKTMLEKLLDQQNLSASYIIDKENAIVVSEEGKQYKIAHQRLVDNKIIEMNKWYSDNYYFGFNCHQFIRGLNLFKIQDGKGGYKALYDYENACFIILDGVWDSVEFGFNNEIYEKYGGFLASFTVSSDIEEEIKYSYINPMTKDRITETFEVTDGKYYALINVDGTIKSNKLFKGVSFSKIEEIVNLDEYESLNAFKEERKQLCNEVSRKRKEQYLEFTKTRGEDSVSPYLDKEVAKMLMIKFY